MVRRVYFSLALANVVPHSRNEAVVDSNVNVSDRIPCAVYDLARPNYDVVH